MSKIDDGGAAFPGPFSGHCGNDGHAEPCSCYVDTGMTLRDYFAAKVIERFLQSWPVPQAAARAYDVADAMIAARKMEKS